MRFDVTYQREFMATPKDKYYTALMYTLFKYNNLRGLPFSNENIQEAVSDVMEETEAEFERYHNEITCDNSYQSPILKKHVLTMNDLVYYESDEHVDMISYSSKQVDSSNEPIKYTHIIDRIRNLSVGVVSVDPAVIRVRIIGQGITQGIINGGTSISNNLATYALTDSSKILFDTNVFRLNKLQSETLVIGLQYEPMKRL